MREWAFAIALSLVCGGVAAEIGLRIVFAEKGQLYQIFRPSGDSRSFELKPNTRVVYRGFWEGGAKTHPWHINADGLRSDRAVPPRSSKYRIMTYGDSETFGWAVALEDTFQRRIEALDPRVEVLNMGVPAYNIRNIADFMDKTIDKYAPDRVIYLSHKNDFEPAMTLSPILSRSWLYNAVQYVLLEIDSRPRKRRRRTPEAYDNFRGQLERLVAICRKRNIPLTIGVLHWEFEKGYSPAAAYAWPPDSDGAPPPFHTDILNFNDIWYGPPRRDQHMAEEAHVEMADRFCTAIARGRPGACTPPGWRKQ